MSLDPDNDEAILVLTDENTHLRDELDATLFINEQLKKDIKKLVDLLRMVRMRRLQPKEVQSFLDGWDDLEQQEEEEQIQKTNEDDNPEKGMQL